MEISATAHYVRVSPRKLKLLALSVKKLKPQQAEVMLKHINKSGSEPLRKVISSALANAKQHTEIDINTLTFKHINVLPGSAMKRFRAVSRGMAHTYKKRMSHVKVVLETKEDKKVINS